MLGSGDPEYERALSEATRQYGFFFRAHVGFSVPLAHRVVAGCDALLMPSRCGGAPHVAAGPPRFAPGPDCC